VLMPEAVSVIGPDRHAVQPASSVGVEGAAVATNATRTSENRARDV
jgi:hypothetical protein